MEASIRTYMMDGKVMNVIMWAYLIVRAPEGMSRSGGERAEVHQACLKIPSNKNYSVGAISVVNQFVPAEIQ